MSHLIFITHPEVVIDPAVPVPDWPLSPTGRARMERFAQRPLVGALTAIHASAERKARDGAEILAGAAGLAVGIDPDLGENDRSSTGYVAPPEFWDIVRAFFAEPEASVRGWERAIDAQRRIVGAVERVARIAPPGDVAVVSHGGVGALLLAHLEQAPIGREFGQPHPGGGCYLLVDRESLTLRSGWHVLEEA
ncbi:MAG TPA: histidine phosphatase family protein [Microvirga sp.]|jgi:broad specificity phosphatase PhoE|nr:histidine phosphatase family protein [Microvirga sp.]